MQSVFPRGRAVLLAVVFVVAAVGAVSATSLWNGSDSLFADKKARRVGDLVTMIIVERAQATQSASTDSGKSSSVEVGPISFADLVPVVPAMGGSGSDSFRSQGSTVRGGTLNARMTAKVVDTLPNGNLLIEGRQTIVVNGEEQVIVISGQVRPQDIQPDNTVLSTFVADATIEYYGTGPIGDKQEPGLLTRIFNWLF